MKFKDASIKMYDKYIIITFTVILSVLSGCQNSRIVDRTSIKNQEVLITKNQIIPDGISDEKPVFPNGKVIINLSFLNNQI